MASAPLILPSGCASPVGANFVQKMEYLTLSTSHNPGFPYIALTNDSIVLSVFGVTS